MTAFQQTLVGAVQALRSIGLPFALIGGVAVSTRTEPRFTQDVDFIVSTQSDQVAQQLAHGMFQRGFTQHALLEDTRTGRIATMRLLKDGMIVDLLVGATGIEDEVVAGATSVDLPGVGPCLVASVAGLLALKTLARCNRNRPDDEADLHRLVAVADARELVEARRLVALIAARGGGSASALEGVLSRVTRALDSGG